MFAELDAAARLLATTDAGFWADRAAAVSWINQPHDRADPQYPGGRINACFNTLDHPVVFGRADELALVTSRVRWTTAELLDYVARAAGILLAGGAGAGDEILLVLPRNEHLAVAVLACSRVGAVAVRSPEGSRATIAIVAASQEESARAALANAASAPAHVVVLQDTETKVSFGATDLDWATAMRPDGVGAAGCTALAAGDTCAADGAHEVAVGHTTALLRWGGVEVAGMAAHNEWSMPDVTSDIDLFAAVHAPLLVGAILRID